MNGAIDFYFDFSSPYGYFASTRVEALAQQYNRATAWHPILLGVVFKTTGGAPLAQQPLKGDYAWRDFERTARFHGIDYRKPTHFPLPTQYAARAMLWVHDHHGGDRAIGFAQAVYRALFVDDVNIGEPAEVMKIADALGIDGNALNAGAGSQQIKDQLKAEIDLAMSRGCSARPT